MYKVRGSDQNEYGPISADVVRQWIAERRAAGTTLAQLEGTGQWKPLSEFAEFAGSFAVGSTPAGYPTQPAAPAPYNRYIQPVAVKTSGMAITSLVLGILGLCGITALVGLILGIVSLVKINKSNGTLAGRGLAIAGICTSCVFGLLSLPFLLGFGSAFSVAKERAQSINCVGNMKQIGLGARMWANDHNDVFPPNIMAMSNELTSPRVLTCLSDPNRTRAAGKTTWAQFDPKNISYEYLGPGMKAEGNDKTPLFRCPVHGHICFGDGSVQQAQTYGSRTRRTF